MTRLIRSIIITVIVSVAITSCATTKVDTSAYEYDVNYNNAHGMSTRYVRFNGKKAVLQMNVNTALLLQYLDDKEYETLRDKVESYNETAKKADHNYNDIVKVGHKYKSIVKYQTKLAEKYNIELPTN